MNSNIDIAIIINPIAGNRKEKNIISVIRKLLAPQWTPLFLTTKRRGHASELVVEHLEEGFKYFVAVGGDGTVNEVASALIGKNASLGIIPCGSGNGLARTLGIPLSVKGAVDCINKSGSLKIDVGTVAGKHFFCTCGTGFDAKIGRKFDKHPKRGFFTYLKITLREFTRYKEKRYSVIIDGKKVKKRALLLTIANATQYGNNAFIAPHADIRDGWLDICFLKSFPFYSSVLLGLRLFSGQIGKSRYYETLKGKEITIKKKKLLFHLDGEPIKLKGPVKIGIKKRSLKVLVNEGS